MLRLFWSLLSSIGFITKGSEKKKQNVIQKVSQVTPLEEAEYSSDDEPLEWSQSGDFVHDVYVESDDEGDSQKGNPRRAPPELSRIKTMLAPSLRNKIPSTGKQNQEKPDLPKIRRHRMKRKPPLPEGLPLQKRNEKKTRKRRKKKKLKNSLGRESQTGATGSVVFSGKDILSSKEYEQALRLHLANAEPYPEVDDDDDNNDDYSDHYIESDSEYDLSCDDEREGLEELPRLTGGKGEEEGKLDSDRYGDVESKYFSFSWDAEKIPSGVVNTRNVGETSLEMDTKGLGVRELDLKDTAVRPKTLGQDDLHFSFSWHHKETTW